MTFSPVRNMITILGKVFVKKVEFKNCHEKMFQKNKTTTKTTREDEIPYYIVLCKLSRFLHCLHK